MLCRKYAKKTVDEVVEACVQSDKLSSNRKNQVKHAFYAKKDCKEKGEEIESMTIDNIEYLLLKGCFAMQVLC